MKIEIKGPIIGDSEQWIYDWIGIPATSASKVNNLINKAQENEELEVLINSGGGSVFAGSEIYTTLKDYKGDVTVKILGVAGSAASVIAMSGKKVLMSPTAQIMIHNSAGNFQGDYHEMELGADILKSVNSSIANAYKIKTGKNHSELLTMMDKVTWLSADKALDLGFIDEIMFVDNQNSIVNETMLDKNGLLPQEVINKFRNEFKGKINLEELENNVVIENSLKIEEIPKLYNSKLELAKAKLKLAIIK